jgi:isoquinoline 1-oxidoreductase beta subunit
MSHTSAQHGSPEVNAWVVIRPDDTVVIRIARSEMGQGSLTGLAQLVAEELECDWSKVTTEYPTPGQNVARKRIWGDYASTGSRSIRESQDYVRKGGAAAREMLIQAAANEWNVPVSEVSAANSVITHKPSGRTTTYGKVAEAAAKIEPPKEVKLKDPKDWKVAGKGVKRLDTADKLTGKQLYSMDVKLPGMLCAAVKESPVFGGKVKSFDAAKAMNMPVGEWRDGNGRTRDEASSRRERSETADGRRNRAMEKAQEAVARIASKARGGHNRDRMSMRGR